MSRPRLYLGGALSRPVSEIVAACAGLLAALALFVCYLWAVGLGLTPTP
ncbi:MAG TPA: hypothetical protein P5234_15840 [Thermoanaerobaculaceae bacterium]|nr:hypothetical protein [Thermoanaerobaculaceae bacterium]